MFASINRCAALSNESVETNNIEINQIKCIVNMDQLGMKPPPFIFVYGLLDFAAFRTKLIDIVGVDNYIDDSSFKSLKIQSSNSDTPGSVYKLFERNYGS